MYGIDFDNLWSQDPETDLLENFIIKTDSYKVTHYKQYPPGTSMISSYLEARGCTPKDKRGQDLYRYTTFFGLQYILQRHFCGRQITHFKIDQAKMFLKSHFGVDLMNEDGWRHIADHYNGRIPLKIKAVREGTKVELHNTLMVIENDDPKVFFLNEILLYWLTNYAETPLSQVWYPTTIATNGSHARDIIKQYQDKTCDSTFVDYSLHDFGFRGVSCYEQACIGGMSHLVNFNGTDTMPAIVLANKAYNIKFYASSSVEIRLNSSGSVNITMFGSSVVATEHSTTTSWGRWGEAVCVINILRSFPDNIKSVVGDSYDVEAFCRMLYENKEIYDLIIALDASNKLVLRPDSGDPVEINCGTKDLVHRPETKEDFKELIYEAEELEGDIVCWEGNYYKIEGVEDFIREYGEDQWHDARYRSNLSDLVLGGRIGILEPTSAPKLPKKGLMQLLWEGFGGITNSKGYKVLNPCIGLIQGDGIDLQMLIDILEAVEELKFATSNIVFGSGGGLLQKFDRDTLKFAIKCSFARINGIDVEVQKDPKTSTGKKSKKGRLSLQKNEKGFYTKQECTEEEASTGFLEDVFEIGHLVRFQEFDEIRNIARS